MYIWPEDQCSLLGWNLELSLDCKVQLMIFVQASAELFLFPRLSCDVALRRLLHPAVSFTSHSSWLFYLTTQNNFGVHIVGNGEHMAKAESSVHPHLCWHIACQIASAKRWNMCIAPTSLYEWAFTVLSIKRKKTKGYLAAVENIVPFVLYLHSATQSIAVHVAEESPLYQRIILT